MGHKPTVDKLLEIFGVGTVHRVRQPRYNDAWSWLVTTLNVALILDQVEPFIVTKAEEAAIARRFLALDRTGKHITFTQLQARERLWDEMRRAKPSFRFRNHTYDE
jgi:hypothetical protein